MSAVGVIDISPDLKKKLRILLEDVNLEQESVGVGARMTVQRAAKKYGEMYRQLLDNGFSQNQIEPAMRALPQGCTSVDVAMDWLMLNIPAANLPKKFTKGEQSQGPVQVLTKASASSRVLKPAADLSSPPVVHTPPSVAKADKEVSKNKAETKVINSKEASAGDGHDNRAWIMQYMDAQGSSDDSDDLEDYDGWSDKAQMNSRKEQRLREKLPLKERHLLVAKELTQAKLLASEAKQKQDKAKQREAGAMIGKLRREMTEIGLTEAMVESLVSPVSSTPSQNVECSPRDSKHNKAPSAGLDEFSDENDALLGFEEDRVAIEHDSFPGLSSIEDHALSQDPADESHGGANNDDDDDGDLGMGLFSGECEWEVPLPEAAEKKAKDVVPWGMKRVPRAEKTSRKLKKPEVTQAVLQSLPRAILARHCQKNDWIQPTFEKLPESPEGLRYAVIVEVRRGNKRTAGIAGRRRFQVSSYQDGWPSVQDAQNAAATVALIHLLPEQQFQHSLPSPFRELYLETLKEVEGEKAEEGIASVPWIDFVQCLAEEKCNPRGPRKNTASEEDTPEEADNQRAYGTSAVALLKNHSGLNQKLERNLNSFRSSKQGREWLKKRSDLPVVQIREKITETLSKANVVVVCGDTGCGKTTQVPQYIFEDKVCRGEGSTCSIICTQPRRLAAQSVSERVAEEMGQTPPGTKGSLLGYHVRLDPAVSSSTQITFCTTGILLRRLAGDSMLQGVSHVVVDEVHERTMQGDFLLSVLRDLVSLRSAMTHPLKVVLMSATLEQSLFSEYFHCPVLSTEGRTFPVEHTFLEDIYDMTGYNLDPEGPAAYRGYGRGDLKALHQKKAGSKAKSSLLGSGWGDTTGDEENTFEILNPNYDPDFYKEWNLVVRRNLARVNEDKIDYELIEQLILLIDYKFDEGSVLVFLPGMGEINQLHRLLAPRKEFDPQWLIRLHSSLTPEEQRRAFWTPPAGIRKVVISTNIAETSLTIPDAVYVIDSGKLKERKYDAGRGISMLVEDWVAKASAKQRKGRAGRVRPGHCFSLFTRVRYDSHMKSYQKPEIMRMPLEEIILQVHALGLGNSVNVMESLVQPPEALAVRKALENLVAIGAISISTTKKESLTPLGKHLANLPVDARIGKLLVMAACFGCLSPALTIAAALSGRSVFITGPDQSQSEVARKKLTSPGTKTIASGENSDLLMVVAAYDGWRKLHSRGWKVSKQFAIDHDLHLPTLEAMKDLRMQFVKVLAENQLLHHENVRGSDIAWVDSHKSPWNKYKNDPVVVKALLCAALYPNIAVMKTTSSGPARWACERNDVLPHSSSIIHGLKCKDMQYPYIVFLEKVKTHKIMLRDCTVASPLSLLLFGGTLKVKHESGVVVVDDWINVRATGDIAVFIKKMRMKLDELILEKLQQPEKDFSDLDSRILEFLVALLRDESNGKR